MEDGEAEVFGEDFDGGLGGLLAAAGWAVGLGVDANDIRSAVDEELEDGDCEVGGAHEDAAEIIEL